MKELLQQPADQIRKGILPALLLFGGLFSSAADLTETDAERILLLLHSVSRHPAGSFLVFTGLDENEDVICEPLSGGNGRERFPAGSWSSTPYFRDTPPYEILLDLCQDYSDAWFFRSTQKQNDCRMRCRLLKLLGHQELSEPLLQLDEILLRCRKTFQQERNRFFELAGAKNPDEDALDDLIKDLSSLLEQRLTEALTVVSQALDRDDPLLAVAAYLHIRHFYFDLRSTGKSLIFRSKDCLDGLHRVTMDLFRQCEKNILSLLGRRYKNQNHVKEFKALFPSARGLWSESPPANLQQLQEFSRSFHQCRRDERKYAPVADFAQWGNLRLSVLLASAAGKETAYLERDFLAALQKYQQIFSHR